MPLPAGGPPEVSELPVWAPTLEQVAAYVPHRTLARSTVSVTGAQDTYRFTFDQTTTPPATTVESLIADGVAWVSALITPLHATSQPLSGLAAALWAAISVERSWPDDDQSLQRANDMEKQLNTMLVSLRTANQQANDDTDGTVDGFDVVYPAYSFPVADLRWDHSGYW